MSDVLRTDLINVVNGWAEKNLAELRRGTQIRTPKELLEYERNLLRCLIQLGALIMAWVLKSVIEDWAFQKEASRRILTKKNRKYRHMCNRTTEVRCLFGGIVRVLTRYYELVRTRGRKCGRGKRGENGSGVYPALEALGIRDGVTPALSSEIAKTVTDGPSMEAAQERLAEWGITLDIKLVKRISERFAGTALGIRNAWLKSGGGSESPLIPKSESLKGLRVLISVDGGRLRTRKNRRGRIANGRKRHGYDTPWREPRLLTIRALDDAGMVIRNVPPVYDGTIDEADGIFDLLEAHLRAREIQYASSILFAGDGAPWIWNRVEDMLRRLGVDLSKVSYEVDYYHATEHLTTVAKSKRGWTERQRSRWLKRMRGVLKRGGIDWVIEALKKLARGRNARIIQREVRYFEERRERMRYDIMAEKKLPIGNGAMESGIRQVVNMRLKGAGMFWHESNAEGFLHLRCYLKARKWNILEQAVIEHAGELR